jgi:hypothetical protein
LEEIKEESKHSEEIDKEEDSILSKSAIEIEQFYNSPELSTYLRRLNDIL